METSLIRVCDATGKTRGTGFVVSDSLAVTCAHVVEACGTAPGRPHDRYLSREWRAA
jgi:V8-like Glu-specific endopeptidase